MAPIDDTRPPATSAASAASKPAVTTTGPSSSSRQKTTTAATTRPAASVNLDTDASVDISSPHELTEWVDKALDQLSGRFEDMRDQVEKRMREMSTRIDNLETSIEELIQGALAPIPSAPVRRTSPPLGPPAEGDVKASSTAKDEA